MSNSLQSKISYLAADFSGAILMAVLESPLEEIVGAKGTARADAPRRGVPTEKPTKPAKKAKKSGRLARRSEEDIAKVVDRIVKLVASKPNGLRAEQIRDELRLEAKELPRPLADALASKQLRKSGDKRATTYFVGGKAAPKKPAAKKPIAKKPTAKKPIAKKPTAKKPAAKKPAAKKPTAKKAAPKAPESSPKVDA